MRFTTVTSNRALVLGLLVASAMSFSSCASLEEFFAESTPAEEAPPEEPQATDTSQTSTAGNPPDMIKGQFVAQVAMPSVVTVVPANNATSVSTGSNIHATYGGHVSPDTVDIDVFNASSGIPVSGAITFQPGSNTVIFNPHNLLAANTKFRVEAAGGHEWFFTTGN